MPEYLSPGVYVEEIPSTIKPIAGVSTSTAAFVGIVRDHIVIPEGNPDYDPTKPSSETNRSWRSWTFPVDDDTQYNKAKEDLSKLTKPNVRPATPSDTSPNGLKAFRAAQDALATAARRRASGSLAPQGQPVLCTTFAEFTRSFGGFSTDGLLPAGAAAAGGGGGAAAGGGGAAGAAPVAENGATTAPGQSQLAHGVFAF